MELDVKQRHDGLNVAAMRFRDEVYIFVFRNSQHAKRDMIRKLGQWAADPELSLDWYAAARLSKAINRINCEV